MIHKLDDIKLFCSECGGVDVPFPTI